MRQRVLFVEANEDGTTGGSHKILADLVTALGTSWQPIVLFYEDNRVAAHLRSDGMCIVAWDGERRSERSRRPLLPGVTGKLRYQAELVQRRRRFLREERIDLVHLNNSPYVGADDWLIAAKLERIPCVVYAMGDARVRAGRIQRFLASRFDAILPLSRFVLDTMVANGLPASRMTLAYPGVEPLRAGPPTDRTATRAALGVSPDQLLAVMVGNIREWKGQHVVLHALARVPENLRARLQVRFIGEAGAADAAYQQRLSGLVHEHHLQDRVQFIGRRNDVPSILAAADIAIHASTLPEPFGLVVLEAMQHGCAVIASQDGGPGEMLTPHCGRTHDPAQPDTLAACLGELIAGDGLRLRLGEAAKQRAGDFSIRAHVAVVEQCYEDVLTHSQRAFASLRRWRPARRSFGTTALD